MAATTESEHKSKENKEDSDGLLICYKLYKTPKIIEFLSSGIDSDFINWNIWDLYSICDDNHQYVLPICTNYLFIKLD